MGTLNQVMQSASAVAQHASAAISGDPPCLRDSTHAPCFQDAKLIIKQEHELQRRFGCWLRANSRGTDATLTVRSSSEPLLTKLRDAIYGRDLASSVQIALSLRYEDTHEELNMRTRH